MLTRTTPTTDTRDTIDRTDEPTIVDRDSHAARGGAPSTAADRRMVLPVQGMTCASCVAHVEKALAQVPGVRKVAVNLATESAAVEGVGLDAATRTGAVPPAVSRRATTASMSAAPSASGPNAGDAALSSASVSSWSVRPSRSHASTSLPTISCASRNGTPLVAR